MIRDDAPSEFLLHRRQILIAGGLVASGVVSAVAATDPSVVPVTTDFMTVSSLLIQHHLNASVGARLAKALTINDAAFPSQVEQLLAIARSSPATTVEEWFPRIPEGPLKVVALEIISAWYVGVIVDVPNAEVFAYELALLFQPTIDVMTIPTYAISGPNGWNSNAPPLDQMPEF